MIENDTIAAVATPHGTGGISVIRVSGPDSMSICDRVFRSPAGKTLQAARSHTVLYGHIVSDGKTVDEVLVTVLRAPHTFTGEDTVEVSCHGGVAVTHAVLSAILTHGASLAAPGEFSKRAFLNGRMDLSQAEAVIDVIQSSASLALDLASHQLEGSVSREIGRLRGLLLDAAAQINALADYPEEEIDELGERQLSDVLDETLSGVRALLRSADSGTLIRDGIRTVIAGRPNVGKSSLLNVLADADRAIVTDIAGTTRDVIEERVSLAGIQLNVFDTAGLRDTDNPVESAGISKAEAYLQGADLVLFVIDAQDGVTAEDRKIAEKLSGKRTILIVNKIDKNPSPSVEELTRRFPAVFFSAAQGLGKDELAQTLETMFRLGEIAASGSVTITNLRHKQALSAARECLSRAKNALGSVPHDLLAIDIADAIGALGEITGQTVSEEVVDRIFSRFCLGK